MLQVMQRQIEDIEKHDQDAMNEFGLPLQTDADFEQINVLLGDKAKKNTWFINTEHDYQYDTPTRSGSWSTLVFIL
ncbi:hypothetical protein LSH36_2651g00001 [Paralvinella palmiformis]|uniref:Uncharacterized protein n=1 Tax=Paralvinella palmiformis TaxID=53620 RepID=A0AAD9IQF2_9ANNE|nr:hypothetical protein LSH36_2651g00001 [Paralvinella palmiformis]